MGERVGSFWPLPGGYKHYLEVLSIFLSKIGEEPPFEELVEWASETLKKSEGWMDSSIRNVIVYSRLARLEGNRISLTDDGLEFLRSKSSEVVLKAFMNRIWGIREIVLWLKQERPLSRKQIFEKCVDFGVKWQHDYQVGYRLMWLQALGMVNKKHSKYYLSSKGEEVAKELITSGLFPEPIKEKPITATVKVSEPTAFKPSAKEPSHSDLQNMLEELGKIEGYRAEREFSVNKERLDVVWFSRVRERPDMAFEIQKGGNFYSALVKLKEAWDKWGCLSILVTTEEYLEDAKRWLGRAFHEMERDARIALWNEIFEWYEAARKRKEVKERLKIDP